MNAADLFALLPFLLIAGTSVLVLLVIAASRRHWLSLCVTLVGTAAAFGSLWLVAPAPGAHGRGRRHVRASSGDGD